MSNWRLRPASLRKPVLSTRLPALACFLLIIVFAVFFSLLSVQQHRAFLTNGLDLGNVDQALWNTARGRFLQFTLMAPVQSRLALHVEPLLLLFVPFYWLDLGGPELLLVTQATVVAIGAWPLYQIANVQLSRGAWERGFLNRNRGAKKESPLLPRSPAPLPPGSPAPLLLFPLAYLLLPTLQSAVLFEFHAVTLAPTLFLFAFLALEQKNNRRFIFWAGLAMACKEDMSLIVVMLGVYAGLAQRRWRLAGLTVALGLSWFVIAFFLIQPVYAAGGNIQLDRYAWLGTDPLAMLQTILTRPGLVLEHLWYQVDLPGYLATLFLPTAFLALFSPLTLLPMLPALAVNLLSDNPFTWRLEDFHYGAPLAPFLFISAIYGIRHLSLWAGQRAVNESSASQAARPRTPVPLLSTLLILLLFTFSAIYHYQRGFTPLSRPYSWPQITTHHRQLSTLLATVPADTTLFTQSNLAPHLTHRQTVYSDFGYFTDSGFPATAEVGDILLDITAFENSGGLHQFLRSTLLEGRNYQLVTAHDGLLHFQAVSSGHLGQFSDSHLPASFYTFTSSTSPLDYPLRVDFGDTVRLHGYSLHFNRQEEVEVTVELESLQPLSDIRPVLYLLDAAGQPVGATVDLPAALVWFPVEGWAIGQPVRLRFKALPWYTRPRPAYGLALGVVQGADVWAVERRYRPVFRQPTNLATRLPAGGTLIELAHIEQRWHIPQGGPRQRQFNQPVVPETLPADFGEQIKLLGYTPPRLSPSLASSPLPNLSLTLYWQAVTTPEPLTRFVQLVGPDGQLYGQQDSIPDFGNYPTWLWQPGEIVSELVRFPVQQDWPGGKYILHIGLYRPGNGERLRLHSGLDHAEIIAPE